MISLALLLLAAEPAADPLHTLQDHARRGGVIARLDGLAAESPQTCAAVCRLNEECQAWTWHTGWIGQAARCDLHSLALTPVMRPGATTGLSPSLTARIDAAIDREPSDRERAALDEASRARTDRNGGLASG